MVAFELLDYGPTDVGTSEPGVWAMRAKVAPFGHNAPLMPVAKTVDNPPETTEWDLDGADTGNRKLLSLDAVYDQITAGGWVVVDRPWTFLSVLDLDLLAAPAVGLVRGIGATSARLTGASTFASSFVLGTPIYHMWLTNRREQIFARVKTIRTLSRASYGITGRVTQLALDTAWLKQGDTDLSTMRDTAVYAQAEALTQAEAPLDEAVPVNDIELAGDYSELLPGRTVVLSGQLAGSAADSLRLSELAEIKAVTTSGGLTKLTLVKNLTRNFRRDSAAINANVALATHGETVAEVVGSGNGSRPINASPCARRRSPTSARRRPAARRLRSRCG